MEILLLIIIEKKLIGSKPKNIKILLKNVII